MPTYYPYVASPAAPFSFQPTLDGAQYLATIRWNLFGQRRYLFLTQLDGTPVVTTPVIESPPSLTLASLSWANGAVTAVTALPHNFQSGSTVALTVSGCVPATYNAQTQAFVPDHQTLTYPLIGDPGPATMLGVADWVVNIVAGYFTTSSLVFRNGQFEVTP